MGKTVTFSNKTIAYYEEEHLVKDLRDARISNFTQRYADKLRMERLIVPIFNPFHREKMYIKLKLKEA